jgi:type IV pilus assembly protein PilC
MSVRTFHYTARTGEGRRVRGWMQAADVRGVVDLLRSRALVATAVNAESDIAARWNRALGVDRISRRALLTFFRSFATLVRAGVPIARSLTVTIERTTDANLAEALHAVLADVEHGSSLSAALELRPHAFAPLYVAMVRAGEIGGILDDVLDRLAAFLERESTLHKKLQTALAYPAVVTIAATGLLIFLLVDIVPMFATLFASFHVELPPATALLLQVSALLALPTVWLTGGAATAVLALVAVRAARHAGAALFVDDLRLRVPIFGSLVRKAITARVVRMLATLLRAGVELTAAIDAVAPVAGSVVYAGALMRANGRLQDGESLAQTLSNERIFDPLLVALVRVGEESGAVDEMLVKLSDYFESDVDAAIATLGAVIEPALILVLGGIVGMLVFSIFLPLYSLIGSVAK